jgi:hypothetical protein
VAELIAGIGLHLLLGLALCGAVWGLGLGVLLLVRWTGSPVCAYPVGLLAATLAAFAVLASPWLAVPVLVVLAAPVAALVRASPRVALLVRACVEPLGWALPGIVGLPLALGLLLHGPTDELDSNAFGDMVFYAAKVVSAEQSVLPFRDLLVEGEPSAYVEAGSSFLGAVLAWIPGFDPFLFQTTLLPTFLLASVSVGLALLRQGGADARSRWLPAAGLLAVAIVAYPTWLTWSPPVMLSLPLTFGVFVIASERLPLGQLALLSGVLAVDYALTKGFGAIVLAVAVLAAFRRDHLRSLRRGQAGLLAAGTIALGAGALAFFLATSGWLVEPFSLRFLPIDAVRGLADQLESRDAQAAGLGVELVGLLLLLAAVVRARAWTFAAALGIALAGHWIVGGHSFDVLVGAAILLAALFFWRRRDQLLAQRWLVGAAGATLALSAWIRDVASVRAGLVFVVLLAFALVGAFAEQRVAPLWAGGAAAILAALAGRSFVGFLLLVAVLLAMTRVPRARSAAAAGAIAIALVLAATSNLALTTHAPTLTTDHHAVWDAAAAVVPPDGLVLTSMTGPVISGDRGWNYYPGVIARQVYLAGWSNSVLLVDDEERARRLRLNAEVLSGGRSPADVPLERRYSSYFAVVRAGDDVPPSFRRLYANDRFGLYRIPA